MLRITPLNVWFSGNKYNIVSFFFFKGTGYSFFLLEVFISGLTLRALIYLELTCVQGVREGTHFIFLHVDTQLLEL